MKRRNFIFTPFLLLAGNGFASSQFNAGSYPNHSIEGVATLLKQFRNPAFVAEVGEHYLNKNPDLNEQNLISATGLNEGLEGIGSVSREFQSKKAHDFEMGNIFCLDGWVLSKAEVSLCALAHITTLNS